MPARAGRIVGVLSHVKICLVSNRSLLFPVCGLDAKKSVLGQTLYQTIWGKPLDDFHNEPSLRHDSVTDVNYSNDLLHLGWLS
jgi:hypothetical protein